MPEKRKVASKTVGIKAHLDEWERWGEAARVAGISLNGWVRRALEQRAELEGALERERKRREAQPEGR